MSTSTADVNTLLDSEVALRPHDTYRHLRRAKLNSDFTSNKESIRRGQSLRMVELPAVPPERLLRNLPPEILNEIFSYILNQHQFVVVPKSDERDFPWNVAAVCSQWRRVVWNVHGLQSTIVVGEQYGSPSTLGTSRWQAAVHSLSHLLCLSTAPELLRMSVHSPFFQIPCFYSHRLRGLKLCSISQYKLEDLFASGMFENLEELDLETDRGTSAIFPVSCVQTMPILQALYLNPDNTRDLYIRVFIPWTQLTEVEICGNVDARDALGILMHSPQLVRGSFKTYMEQAMSGLRPFTLFHLTYLCISQRFPFNINTFLEVLNLPALQELHVCLMESMNHQWSHQPFTSLITRSRCVITHLVLEIDYNQWARVNLAEHSIEPLLHAVPSVKRLKIPAVIPSYTFDIISQDWLLAHLENVEWALDAAGVEQYIAWLLTFGVDGGHSLTVATASCHVGRRFLAAEVLLNTKKLEIAQAGIKAELCRAGKGEIPSCYCQDPRSEDEENRRCPWF